MQTGVLRRFHRVRPRSGFRLKQVEMTVAASQTIKKYDMLSMTSGADTVEQTIADPGSDATASTISGGNLPIFGVAAAPITTGAGGSETTTGRTKIPVWVWDDNLEYCMRIYHATPASAEPRDLARGTQYQFYRYRVTANEILYALGTVTTNGELVFVDIPDAVDPTDDYGPVWVRANTVEVVRQG